METRVTGTNMKSVGGTLIAMVQHCTQGLHATTEIKSAWTKERKRAIHSHRRQCGNCDGHNKG